VNCTATTKRFDEMETTEHNATEPKLLTPKTKYVVLPVLAGGAEHVYMLRGFTPILVPTIS
jgi:hypothetical protein